MAEAFIVRRGGSGSGSIITGDVQSTSASYLTITDLIGAKNAVIIAYCTGGTASGSGMVYSILIEDGEVSIVTVANSSGYVIENRASYITFDSTTGKLTSSSTAYASFTTATKKYYRYIVFS